MPNHATKTAKHLFSTLFDQNTPKMLDFSHFEGATMTMFSEPNKSDLAAIVGSK